MYSRPSAPNNFEPLALLMKIGWPPTARNARTGEFTPPGKRFSARSSRRLEVSSLMRLFVTEAARRAPSRRAALPTSAHFEVATPASDPHHGAAAPALPTAKCLNLLSR